MRAEYKNRFGRKLGGTFKARDDHQSVPFGDGQKPGMPSHRSKGEKLWLGLLIREKLPVQERHEIRLARPPEVLIFFQSPVQKGGKQPRSAFGRFEADQFVFEVLLPSGRTHCSFIGIESVGLKATSKEPDLTCKKLTKNPEVLCLFKTLGM